MAGRILRRRIPSAVRDLVLQRSRHRCEYVAGGKRRCRQRVGLTIDHIRPWAMGGDHQIDNLRALCRAHNLRKAQADFGDR